MIELFRETVSNLQSAMSQIESVVDAPAFVNDPAYPRFRHEEKSQKTAIFLKGVRIVSALNASIALLERGHIQECSVLYRTIDEFLEDIVFLKPPGADEEPSEAQQKFLTEFYQEEFDTGKSPLSSTQKRHRVPRRTIYNAIAQITSAFLNTYDGRELHRTISQTMSGYVHGAYPHIMELYGGDPPHYHLEGMLGTAACLEAASGLGNISACSLASSEARSSTVAGAPASRCPVTVKYRSRSYISTFPLRRRPSGSLPRTNTLTPCPDGETSV